MKNTGVHYLLAGFTQNTGFRVFAFEGVTGDWVRTTYSVTADLAMARKYGIQMQELPLLCRGVLDRRSENDERRAFTFSESDMTTYADLVRAARESHKRQPPRRPFAAVTAESALPVQPA